MDGVGVWMGWGWCGVGVGSGLGWDGVGMGFVGYVVKYGLGNVAITLCVRLTGSWAHTEGDRMGTKW